MALKAIIYKAQLQVSNLDDNLYSDHSLTIARHPSETDERLVIRLLAFALNVPKNPDHATLEFAKDMWEADAPSLSQKDLTGQITHWIEVGQPDEKRLLRAAARIDQVSVYSFSSSTPIWWKGIAPTLSRTRNLHAWQIPSLQSQSLASLAKRTMDLHLTLQDGSIWFGDGSQSIEVSPIPLHP
ncbi:MAG: YaeQ family protein [Verrucomicrobiota bacterium]